MRPRTTQSANREGSRPAAKRKRECPKCNHPIYTGGFLLQPNLDFGIWAGVTWDGGDTCQVVEFIAYDPIPNPPFQQPNGADLNENGPQYRVPHIPDDVTPIAGANGEAQDKHEVPRGLVQSPPTTGGTITVKQTVPLCL